MNLKLISVAAAIGAILFGAASCIKIDSELGGNFIPTDQLWDVFPCEPVALEDITMKQSVNLSGYSTTRFAFGSVKDDNFTCTKGTSFTLVPLSDSLDFGDISIDNIQNIQFHLAAVRDTVSVLYDSQLRMLQNVYVYSLTEPLDSNILYTGDRDKIKVDLSRTITEGIPVYNGGDSLSFNFSSEYARAVMKGIEKWQSEYGEDRADSLSYYLKHVPGVYMETAEQTVNGGRINMFDLSISASDGYINGNYAELKIRSEYDGKLTDTSFLFYFGPSEFLKESSTSYPTQYAFNTSTNSAGESFFEDWNNGAKDKLYVEGGSGYKPVVSAKEIKRLVNDLIAEKKAEGYNINEEEVVINKATIILPYNIGADYEKLERYPMILSPTVRIPVSDGDQEYISYAGLTDSSIESENQGNINRSLSLYSPDVSHHIQEIVKLKRGEGKKVESDESPEDYQKRVDKYDIWFLILHEEITESSSSNSSYNDYYNNLLYNSYYNNMMYDPYGYGYGYGGYGYGGYGYGSYGGYGYNNYYNYLMMAQYASAANSSTTQTSSSIELDKDRFYSAVLNGPGAGGEDVMQKPRLKITFSAPMKAEE